MPQPIHIISGISLVLGLVLLLTSCLFLDMIGKVICLNVRCSDMLPWSKAAGSFGIIASIIQITAFPAALFKQNRIWLLLQMLVFVMTVTAYSIALDRQVNDFWATSKIFMSFTSIDMTYTFLALGAGYYFLEIK